MGLSGRVLSEMSSDVQLVACMYICIHLNICSDTSTSLAAEIGGTDQF